MSTKPGGSDDLYYCLQQSWGKVMFLHRELVAAPETCAGWQAGGTHPTAMLSYLLIKIGCCDLFLKIYFLKSIFIKRTSFGTTW